MERESEMKNRAQKLGEKLGKEKSWEKVLLLAACRKKDGGGAPCTTPVVSWEQLGASNTMIKGDPFSLSSISSFQISARKLAAALWEFQHYFTPATIYFGVNNPHRMRRHLHRVNKDEGIDHHHHHHQTLPLDPDLGGSPDHDMAPYNPAATPDSSIELKGRIGESSYGFKTSAELLKVLNRIWSLEEQHASNMSLVKALKNELHHARSKIKDLLRDQQANRRKIDELMKQISGDSLARKNQEQERIDATLQSVRDELEDERKLRKRSESLHRKLARELFEMKVALSTTAKELERERRSSELLEELCDEFAKGIREYATQLHATKQKTDKDWTVMTDHDNLLLHISESWLDERMQVKDKEAQGSTAHKTSVVEKLSHEIGAFLSARKTVSLRDPQETRVRRCSLESIPEASTPPCIGHEDAAFSDSHRVEISKAGPSNYEEQEELPLSRRRKGQTPPSLQMSDIQSTPPETDANIRKTSGGTSTEISMLKKSDIYDTIEGTHQQKRAYNDEGEGSNSKTVDKLMSELLLSEGGSYSFPPEYEYKEVSSSKPALRRNASPVRQWMTSMTSLDPRISESSSKTQPVRDNTLKAKLQEPKTKGQRSHLKILKSS